MAGLSRAQHTISEALVLSCELVEEEVGAPALSVGRGFRGSTSVPVVEEAAVAAADAMKWTELDIRRRRKGILRER